MNNVMEEQGVLLAVPAIMRQVMNHFQLPKLHAEKVCTDLNGPE